jgi:hypothetical protein
VRLAVPWCDCTYCCSLARLFCFHKPCLTLHLAGKSPDKDDVDASSGMAALKAENEWLREQLQQCAEVLHTAHMTALMKNALGRVRRFRSELAGRHEAPESDDAHSARPSPIPLVLSNAHLARMSCFSRQDSGHDSSGQPSPACSGRTSPLDTRPTQSTTSTCAAKSAFLSVPRPHPRPFVHTSNDRGEHTASGRTTDNHTTSEETEGCELDGDALSLADDLRLSGAADPPPLPANIRCHLVRAGDPGPP